ncbi:uncharacterized protein LOC112347187 isoform X1 [Selaginella moellendorffii]|uniref:uncharacterized protein LOC112347187 isoform X1 n=1 Tax=Selaginella moellendorffii TaxID=88036 RepID=UPI000D1C2940|nr:uncharacterized protein LOC112347187 isoform X1 [Selaginella moellendorffii]|eukprot:XP_024533416.1 uncharacterized protein LOC112347187 isoform X1 [Selaginella moellendorffii]
MAVSCGFFPGNVPWCAFGASSGLRSRMRPPMLSRSIQCCAEAAIDEAAAVELPCLPFKAAEVLVPSSTKTLHLYEARFLALLEEVKSFSSRDCFVHCSISLQALRKCHNLFVHVVIERTGRSANEYAFRYGCLSHILHVKRLEVGALVTIRGIGRVRLISLSQMEPFLKGVVVPVKDETPKDADRIQSSVESLKKTLSDVQQLQIKLKVSCALLLCASSLEAFLLQTSKDELLQTPLQRALEWAERANFGENLSYFVPNREERLSFAALQPISGANAGELRQLLERRLVAMDSTDTLERLTSSMEYAQHSRSSVAAKVAIQSLQL